jgi:hypothetical protein
VHFDLVRTNGLGFRVPHITVEVSVGIVIKNGYVASQTMRDPIMVQNAASMYNAVIQHQLANRSLISRCDREISLSGYEVNGNMPPTVVFNSQGTKKVSLCELIQWHVAGAFDNCAREKRIKRTVYILRSRGCGAPYPASGKRQSIVGRNSWEDLGSAVHGIAFQRTQ